MAKLNGKKCSCNMGMTLLALIFMSIAVYLLAMGFIAQFNNHSGLGIIAWYFIGLLVLMIAKMCKWKGHMSCPVHGMRV